MQTILFLLILLVPATLLCLVFIDFKKPEVRDISKNLQDARRVDKVPVPEDLPGARKANDFTVSKSTIGRFEYLTTLLKNGPRVAAFLRGLNLHAQLTPRQGALQIEYMQARDIERKLSRGCHLWDVEGITTLALNKRNAIRKYLNTRGQKYDRKTATIYRVALIT